MRHVIILLFGFLLSSLQAQDYSSDFYKKFIQKHEDSTEYLEKLKVFNFSNLWIYEINKRALGFIGKNYQKIDMHINKIIRNELDKSEYLVYGKTKVKKNICDFLGKIKILHIRTSEHGFYTDSLFCGSLIAKYEFFEAPSQKHSGYFKGFFQSYFAIKNNKDVVHDEFWDEVDGASNYSFVGVWISYKTRKILTCNFGQYSIPYSGDLDISGIDFYPNPKYKKYGWDWENPSKEDKEWWK